VSDTLCGASSVPHGVFQPELRNRLAYPSLRPIRLASFYRMSDLFNLFLGLLGCERLTHFRWPPDSGTSLKRVPDTIPPWLVAVLTRFSAS